MSRFSARRELLNPLFEGYKLSIIEQDDAISRHSLHDHSATQSTVSSLPLLTFKEVQSRILHNHLATYGKHAVYVDADFNLISIDMEPVVSLRVVADIPRPLQTSAVMNRQKEYPSACFLSASQLFLCDGHGSLYLFETSHTGSYKLISSYELSGSLDSPFRIHSADSVSPERAVVVLSSRNYEPSHAMASKITHVDFDIWGVQFDFTTPQMSPEMSVIWHRRGDDVPLTVFYHAPRQSHILLGASQYQSMDAPTPPSYDPSAEEMAPIPRANENLDSKEGLPPPYSWTQTSDSLTVAYPLPATTVRSNIHVKFLSSSVSLRVKGSAPEGFTFPAYDDKPLWAPVDSSSSVWTWDREADRAFGLLTLHLEKQHDGTKWMQVFASAATNEDEEVPETVDPSELYKIRESLEKYTASLRTGEDMSGLGLGTGVPSLAEGEMDEEVDASIGKMVFMSVAPTSGPQSANLEQYPLRVLSTPLPGVGISPSSLIVKEHVDGVLISLEDDLTWAHTSSFFALAFVLASKQDTRFVYHTGNTVLAFESGAQHRGGNVYIYRSSPPNDRWAKQSVLQVGNGLGGSLLGVSSVALEDGSRCIVCLTETELVTIRNIC